MTTANVALDWMSLSAIQDHFPPELQSTGELTLAKELNDADKSRIGQPPEPFRLVVDAVD